MIGIIFALVAGLLMSVQGVFNTRVMESSTMWVTNIWVQFTAFITCFIIWIIADRKNLLSVFDVNNKLYLIGGIVGAFITFSVIKGIAKLGPTYAIMLILLSQLIVAYIIEVFGLFGTEKGHFEWSKLIGVVIMIVGILIFKKK